MPSFQHFQRQAEQKAAQSKFSNDALSLSGLLQYAESAKKQSFEAVCRLHPLVKTYRDKIGQTSRAMLETESSLGEETEIPPTYVAALSQVKEGFKTHLGALDGWLGVLTQKREADSEKAIAGVKQTGEQLQAALNGLSIPK